MKSFLAALIVVAVGASAIGDLRLYASDWSRWGPLGPGDEIPAFKGRGVDNAGISNAELTGNVTLLTFWASWCGPCAKEMPAIEAVAQAYKGQGVHVVGVNRDREGDPAAIVRAYKVSRNLSFDMVLDPGNMGRAFRVSMIPHLVMVGPAGRIRFVHQGAVSESTLREEIDGLLREMP